MNRIIATIAFIIICNVSFAYSSSRLHKQAVTIDTTTNLIMQLDFDSFRGKPIDSFLAKIPQNYSIDRKLHSRAITPNGLVITYPNGNYIYIYINHPLCCVSNPHALPNQWSLTEIRMEKADDITLFDGETCLKGCHPDTEYN